MKRKTMVSKKQLPEIFRPFLWWAKWGDLDVEVDKEDIIVSAVNEGSLSHWRWLIGMYGKDTIRKVLENRLASEFHPESRSLAKAIFSLSGFRHARESIH
ncbi:MAG: hypothetical protein A3C82_00860 [Candidatus Wildermuthbacteria bacterium RIFCSPHIGHO2_02_FULL_47_12]|uniref:DUF6922 domain-containing protein n=2 Tax=Parcubacteria group TaxID=1794811 RepID=A0A1G2R337_9BACT|nr:MAG: hypothetical protein A3A24_01195 [Candidatus Buchananbacteria bacterium RIFCSPLOWO2_01_FULL_46_12]OHA67203.1 MAG: hypothetical protein A3C82_00860 [Candidatus Wildermuthbacteria bacterium RIFCSPHIGHO2_02_FULL_47_12]